MSSYNPKNERIKTEYFRLLKEADQMCDATVNGVRKAILRFEEFTGYADFMTFDSEQCIGFKRHLASQKAIRTGEPLRQATIRSTLHAVRDLFRWLAREPGYKSKIRASDIRFLNMSRKDEAIARAPRSKKVPTLEQIRFAIDKMPASTDVEKRDRALIAFTIVTGMRDSAIASLRLKHIDLDRMLVTQDPSEVNTKFSKHIETFFFPVDEDLVQIVIDWVRYLREVKLWGNDDPVFPQTHVVPNAQMSFQVVGIKPEFWSTAGPIRKIFKHAFLAAGLPYFTPHSFRTTLGILGEQICRTPEEFKAWSQNLGHENPLTTFTSYGQVPTHRQGQLIRGVSKGNRQEDKIDKLMQMVEKMGEKVT